MSLQHRLVWESGAGNCSLAWTGWTGVLDTEAITAQLHWSACAVLLVCHTPQHRYSQPTQTPVVSFAINKLIKMFSWENVRVKPWVYCNETQKQELRSNNANHSREWSYWLAVFHVCRVQCMLNYSVFSLVSSWLINVCWRCGLNFSRRREN